MRGLEALPRLMCVGLFVSAALALSPLSSVFADEPSAPTTDHPGEGASPAGEQAGKDPLLAERLQHRLSGRFSLDLNLGIAAFKHQSNAGDPFALTRLLFGYRKHFDPELGFQLRGGPMLARPRRVTSGDPGPDGAKVDTTILTGGSIDGLLVLGPFGRFFLGPVLCLDYVYLTKTTLPNVYPTVHLRNGITAGGGFDLGAVFGSREQVGLYQSLRITAGAGESIISLLFGISYSR